MAKLNLTKVWIDKELTKFGSNKVGLKTKEYGDRWVSGFAKDCKWKEGDEIEVDVSESPTKGKDGKPYLNWKFPKKDSGNGAVLFHIDLVERKLKEDIEDLRKRIYKMERWIENSMDKTVAKSVVLDYPEYEGQPDFGEEFDTEE